MDKIDFKNLPNSSTPINAANLNLLQDNVENAINSSGGSYEETVLFEGDSNAGAILDYTSADYDKLLIIASVRQGDTDYYISNIIDNPNQKYFNLSATTFSGSSLYYYFANYKINGLIVSLNSVLASNTPAGRFSIGNSESWTPFLASTNYIYLKKIIGIKNNQ